MIKCTIDKKIYILYDRYKNDIDPSKTASECRKKRIFQQLVI